MKRAICLILALAILCSCGDSDATMPEGVLAKEQMAEVLVDVQLLEASLNLNNMNPQRVGRTGTIAELRTDVYKKHNITAVQFNESFNYYCAHPEELTQVYQLVLNELSRMQAQVNAGR